MGSTDNFWPPHSRNGIISAINLLANSHYIDLKTTLLEECEKCSNKKTADGQTEEIIQGRRGDSKFLAKADYSMADMVCKTYRTTKAKAAKPPEGVIFKTLDSL